MADRYPQCTSTVLCPFPAGGRRPRAIGRFETSGKRSREVKRRKRRTQEKRRRIDTCGHPPAEREGNSAHADRSNVLGLKDRQQRDLDEVVVVLLLSLSSRSLSRLHPNSSSLKRSSDLLGTLRHLPQLHHILLVARTTSPHTSRLLPSLGSLDASTTRARAGDGPAQRGKPHARLPSTPIAPAPTAISHHLLATFPTPLLPPPRLSVRRSLLHYPRRVFGTGRFGGTRCKVTGVDTEEEAGHQRCPLAGNGACGRERVTPSASDGVGRG